MTVVVKLGGAAGNTSESALAEVVHRRDVVLVHGGSEEIDRLGQALGRPPALYTSPSGVTSRRTSPEDLEVVVLALAGKVQTSLVASLAGLQVPAVGLSGVDGGLLTARRKTGVRAVVGGKVVHLADDRSGTIERVRPELLNALLASHFVPVVGPPAVTPTGEVVNVDADRTAAAIAVALGAEALVLLTNVPGLLTDIRDPGSRVDEIPVAKVEEYLPLAAGRMRKKLLAAREAVTGGVPRAVIAPSRVSSPIQAALTGAGTLIQ